MDIEKVREEAADHAKRIVALGWARKDHEDKISGAWEAGYVAASIDAKKSDESPSPDKTGWISVETPPEEEDWFLVCKVGYIPYTACFSISSDGNSWQCDGEETFPTHWMPLPSPPSPIQNK